MHQAHGAIALRYLGSRRCSIDWAQKRARTVDAVTRLGGGERAGGDVEKGQTLNRLRAGLPQLHCGPQNKI